MKNSSRGFFTDGIVKTAIKQGDYVPPRDVEKENKIKDFCLNCKMPICRGNCEDFRKFMKELNDER